MAGRHAGPLGDSFDPWVLPLPEGGEIRISCTGGEFGFTTMISAAGRWQFLGRRPDGSVLPTAPNLVVPPGAFGFAPVPDTFVGSLLLHVHDVDNGRLVTLDVLRWGATGCGDGIVSVRITDQRGVLSP